ncbi:SRPBCC family protein [Mariniluteicoccus flavus]
MTQSAPQRVSQQRVINAPADRIFAILADIRNHAALDGSGTITGTPDGPIPLVLGAHFSMGMKRSGFGYRSGSEVVEFVPDRVLAWRTATVKGSRTLFGGHVWRWELEPRDDGTTLVRATFDWSPAVAKPVLIGLMRADRDALASLGRSLQCLASLVEA